MKTSHRIAAIAFRKVRRFVAIAAERTGRTAEHSWKRTDGRNSTVATTLPSFRLLTDSETEALLGDDLLAALSGVRRQ